MHRFRQYRALILLFLIGFSGTTNAKNDKINIVITAAFVSENGLDVYREIGQYIGNKLGAQVNIITGTSYTESSLLLEQGVIHVGFVCGLPYTQQAARGKLKLLAIPVMASAANPVLGTPGYRKTPGKYFSYTIVHKDSPINSWAELKGKRYVYNDQSSNSGYNMPRYKLIQLGAESWEDYFSQIEVSGSHEESIRMVARGLTDASSVDSLVLDYDRQLNNTDANNVKVIETLFPAGAGAPPVVASTHLSAEVSARLSAAFVDMKNDPEGQAILNKALLLRFDPPDDSNYNDIRQMEKAALEAGFRNHKR